MQIKAREQEPNALAQEAQTVDLAVSHTAPQSAEGQSLSRGMPTKGLYSHAGSPEEPLTRSHGQMDRRKGDCRAGRAARRGQRACRKEPQVFRNCPVKNSLGLQRFGEVFQTQPLLLERKV